MIVLEVDPEGRRIRLSRKAVIAAQDSDALREYTEREDATPKENFGSLADKLRGALKPRAGLRRGTGSARRRARVLRIPQHDAHAVRAAVVDERDGAAVDRHAVELGLADAAAAPRRIRDRDLVARRADAPGDLVAGPRRRDARVDLEGRRRGAAGRGCSRARRGTSSAADPVYQVQPARPAWAGARRRRRP